MAEPTYQDPSKGNTGNTEDDNKFNQMLKLLSVVNGMNGQTLLGFALGRFLKGAYKRWEDGREWKKQREMYTKNGWVHPDGTLYSDEEVRAAKEHAWRVAQQKDNATEFWGFDKHDPLGVNQQGYGGGLTPQQRAVQGILGAQAQPTQTAAQPTTAQAADVNTATPQPAGTSAASQAAQPAQAGTQAASSPSALDRFVGQLSGTTGYGRAAANDLTPSIDFLQKGSTADAKTWDTNKFGELQNQLGKWGNMLGNSSNPFWR